MVSNSFSPKLYQGESTSTNQTFKNSFLFVYKMLFNTLHWNSLNLVSNVVLKGSRYIFSQPTELRCVHAERSFISFALLVYWIF